MHQLQNVRDTNYKARQTIFIGPILGVSSCQALSSDAEERLRTCSSLYFKYLTLIKATLSTLASRLLTSFTRNATA